MRIKNISTRTLPFVVGQKDGEPVVDEIKAGETKDITVKRGKENATVKARLHAGLIELPDEKPAKPAPAAKPAQPQG